MDKLAALGDQLSQVTMYDLKSYYAQAKNMVLNVSETEAKVLEATNDDAWGASSSLMQEIAAGTFNFQQFNEIMPTIYKRFMEKEAREWRQIYKALQLLEYLVKNGSERVVDDARSHVSTIKMLRNFHYIDEKGKDQGLNVRNRAKEIGELLSDVEKIRTERRKAKQNQKKYVGIENNPGGPSFSSGGSRYGGFGSDSLGGGVGGGYDGGSSYGRNGGGGSGSGGSSFRDSTPRPASFDEYDAGDDEDRTIPTPSARAGAAAAARSSISSRATPARTGSGQSVVAKGREEQKKAQAPPPKAVDLFDFGDDDLVSASPVQAQTQGSAAVAATDDDDFDDFQQAPSAPIQPSAPAAAAPASKASDLFDFFDAAPASAPSAPSVASPPPQYNSYAPPPVAAAPPQAYKPNYSSMPSYTQPSSAAPASISSLASTKPKAASGGGMGGFDDLWSSSLGSFGSKPAVGTSGAGGAAGKRSMADMEREKTQANLWGSGTGGSFGTSNNSSVPPSKPAGSNTFDDLLL